MEALIAKVVALIENFYLATYIIAGSAIGIGVDLFGVSFFGQEILISLGRCYFAGMVASRVSSLIVEPLSEWLKLVKREPYEQYMRAEQRDATGKLISMTKVSGLYCTMSASSLIVLLTGITQMLLNIQEWQDYISRVSVIMFITVLFLLSYRKQTGYVVMRINYLNQSHTRQDEISD